MDEAEFDEVVKGTRLSSKSREAARRVLVHGNKQVDAGNEYGLSKQRMTQIIDTIEQAAEKYRADKAMAPSADANALLALMDASYAVAVQDARAKLGDHIAVVRPTSDFRSTGEVVARSAYHLAQSIGRDKVLVHDAAKLDIVPSVGRVVTVQYKAGLGVVSDRTADRQQGLDR